MSRLDPPPDRSARRRGGPSVGAAATNPLATLGPLEILALGINGIVGAGIMTAPPIVAAAVAGERGALVYVAVAIGCMPVALCYVQLTRVMPVDGGPVVYAGRAFGPRALHAVGALTWACSLFSTAAVTRALADLVTGTFDIPALAPYFAVAFTFGLAIVNMRGLRMSAVVWTALTAMKIAPLLVLSFLGLRAPSVNVPGHATVAIDHRSQALLAVLFALQGFEIVPLPAGQVRNAERVVPRATLGALAVTAVLYAAIHLACARALPDLASDTSAIPHAARVLGGAALARGVRAGVVASLAGIVIGMHAMTPRYFAAMATATGPAEPHRNVNIRAITLSAMLVSLLVAAASLPSLIDVSSVAVLAQYGVTAASLGTLAWRRRDGLAPSDAWAVFPALGVVGVLLAQARLQEILVAAGLAAMGAVIARGARSGRG